MVLHVETLNYVNPKILLFCILLWIKYDKKPKNKKICYLLQTGILSVWSTVT